MTGKDKKGCFARWGSQKKYYFECGNDQPPGLTDTKVIR